jgi:hypothetical protein
VPDCEAFAFRVGERTINREQFHLTNDRVKRKHSSFLSRRNIYRDIANHDRLFHLSSTFMYLLYYNMIMLQMNRSLISYLERKEDVQVTLYP